MQHSCPEILIDCFLNGVAMPVECLDDEAIADIAFIVRSSSLHELFEEACEAVFKLQTNTELLTTELSFPVHAAGDDLERLLYDILSETIFYRDAEFFFGKIAKIDVQYEADRYNIKGTFYGETFDDSRHVRWNDVKAITMHDFYVKKIDSGWESYILVDI